MATRLAETIYGSRQIEASQDWKTVVNLKHPVIPTQLLAV
jgi:hypothetical protein